MSHTGPSTHTQVPVHHRTARISGFDVFYREAGPHDAPVLLLLRGLPTSSNMFRHLIPRLAGSFHLVAPDHPGFGQSSMPDRARFAYTFENLTSVVEELVEQLGLGPLSLYVMDYGAPIGDRLALRRPAQARALVVQNGNAYEEGLREFGDPIKAYGADPRRRSPGTSRRSCSGTSPAADARQALLDESRRRSSCTGSAPDIQGSEGKR